MHPLHATEDGPILDDVLVRREQDLELARANLVLQRTPLGRVALVGDHFDPRRPLGEFARPVRHGRERDNDEVRAPLLLDLDQEGNKRDRLDRFAEALQTLLAHDTA